MHEPRPSCGLGGCLRRRGHSGPCTPLRSPLTADEEQIALALLKPRDRQPLPDCRQCAGSGISEWGGDPCSCAWLPREAS